MKVAGTAGIAAPPFVKATSKVSTAKNGSLAVVLLRVLPSNRITILLLFARVAAATNDLISTVNVPVPTVALSPVNAPVVVE